ncbi:hypothetical protein IFM89_030125 [Coptis chinensis]|uniref:Cytochrome P450 n=1 Tax=Coptis chinensis TaxID=261450 RepID=A0A835M5D3_9MAGN|nr:hypothetical protein IFM89_030125 [Coptis chinensis]
MGNVASSKSSRGFNTNTEWRLNVMDPKAWSEPTIFKPERFEKDRKGNEGLQWMPFGVGRRGCPGEGFAKRMLGLMLGILIQCFDWEQVGGEMVDMTTIMERDFILKAKPLEAMYMPSKSMFNVLS